MVTLIFKEIEFAADDVEADVTTTRMMMMLLVIMVIVVASILGRS